MKLIKLDKDLFRVVTDKSVTEGSWNFIEAFMQHHCGIEWQEIQIARGTMEAHGHDTASFGILKGMFTHSSQSRMISGVLAELKAVESLRQEFTEAFKENKGSPATKDAYDRLMSMYMALNVTDAIELLDGAEEQKIA